MWRPGRSKTLKKEALILDAESSHGAFAEASAAFEFPEGEGLPGRCFKLRDVEHCASLQSADSNDPRADIAKDNGVRGAFAIFRDGAVWEFGGTPPMSEKPPRLPKSATELSGISFIESSFGLSNTTSNIPQPILS